MHWSFHWLLSLELIACENGRFALTRDKSGYIHSLHLRPGRVMGNGCPIWRHCHRHGRELCTKVAVAAAGLVLLPRNDRQKVPDTGAKMPSHPHRCWNAHCVCVYVIHTLAQNSLIAQSLIMIRRASIMHSPLRERMRVKIWNMTVRQYTN